MSKQYFVIGEIRDGKLRQVSLEALQAARLLAEDKSHIHAILIGKQLDEITNEFAAYVSSQLFVVEDDSLASYSAELYSSAISNVIGQQDAVIILGHTAIGRDLAPQLAAKLNAGQISDVTAIEGQTFIRPIYAGKAFEKKKFTDEGTQIITIRPNNIPIAEQAASPASIEKVSFSAPSDLRAIVKDIVRKASGKVDLAEAKVVVSGGRGVKSVEGFKPLEQLAEVLGGAVGASRGACDAGYCDYSLQIGQTGKVVTPILYIACGISGAIQHLAGMSQSKVIIAINKDPEAPIFKVADYGIVGDLFEVVPILTEELSAAKQV